MPERRHKAAALVAIVLAFALLLCHGAMGSLHLPMEPHGEHAAVGGHEHHASHKGDHGGLLAAHHEAEIEYFAVLSIFLLAASLFALRPKFERLPARVAARFTHVRRSAASTPLPRGPTLPLLQVFRL